MFEKKGVYNFEKGWEGRLQCWAGWKIRSNVENVEKGGYHVEHVENYVSDVENVENNEVE